MALNLFVYKEHSLPVTSNKYINCNLQLIFIIIFSLCLSDHFNSHFPWWSSVSRYQNVSILDFNEAKDD